MFADNKVLTVFELFQVEIPKEIFRQLKCKSLRTLLQPNENPTPIIKQGCVRRTCLHLYIVELLLMKSP